MDIIERLRRIKALAENGSLGEKEAAQQIYERLKKLHNISDNDIAAVKLEKRIFRYDAVWEKSLLSQVIYMVTGGETIYGVTGKRQLLVNVTEREAQKIELYYIVYKAALKKHMEAAFIAFINVHGIFPDENVRVHKRPKNRFREPDDDIISSAQALMAMMSRTSVPVGLIGGGSGK